MTEQDELVNALENLRDSEDSTGCEGDVTVVSKSVLADAVMAALDVLRMSPQGDLGDRCDMLEQYATGLQEDEEEEPQ